MRLSPKGTISIRANDYDVRGRVANISTGGILANLLVTAPDRLIGEPVDLELRLDTQQSAWLHLRGRVLRIGSTTIAISLDVVPDSFERVIDESLTASHSRKRVLSIVIVDATLSRRLQMAEAFRASGCAVVDVSTPLEAIVRLGEFHFEPDVIAIADSLPSSIASELRTFINMAHPRAKLVTIGDHAVEPEGLAHWLSSFNPDGDLAKRVLALLMRRN